MPVTNADSEVSPYSGVHSLRFSCCPCGSPCATATDSDEPVHLVPSLVSGCVFASSSSGNWNGRKRGQSAHSRAPFLARTVLSLRPICPPSATVPAPHAVGDISPVSDPRGPGVSKPTPDVVGTNEWRQFRIQHAVYLFPSNSRMLPAWRPFSCSLSFPNVFTEDLPPAENMHIPFGHSLHVGLGY